MKDVAKSLRLDLAAYRELESFAQLGVELDAATKRQLDRGERMVKLLIQPQYQPMPVMDQVIAIYAGAHGHLDDLKASDVAAFEAGLLKCIKDEHRDFYDEITADKKLGGDRPQRLEKIIVDYKETFKQRNG
jgi:F-type H+-transporting ATPase subunit alpha